MNVPKAPPTADSQLPKIRHTDRRICDFEPKSVIKVVIAVRH